jgi:hypothetical protein
MRQRNQSKPSEIISLKSTCTNVSQGVSFFQVYCQNHCTHFSFSHVCCMAHPYHSPT